MAIEMGEKSWKLLLSGGGVKTNGQLRVYQTSVEGNDYVAVGEAVAKAKERFKLSSQAMVVSCYEAGQDGFWPHRRLAELGITNRVVDSICSSNNLVIIRDLTYQSVPDLYQGLTDYFLFYNHQRPHSALGGQTPAEVHWASLPTLN
jgi:hypothetical protein